MGQHQLLLLLAMLPTYFFHLTAASSSSDAYPTVTDGIISPHSDEHLVPVRREVYGNGRIIDITHRYVPDMPEYGSKDPMGQFLWVRGSMKNKSRSNTSVMKLFVHAGTHVDAPGHFYDHYFDAGFDVDTLDLDVLMGPALLVDVPRESNITGSPEFLLQLLQHFIEHQSQVKQIHSLLITKGHLIFNPGIVSHSKWKPTLLYNTLIRAHLNFGQNHKALRLFTLMLANRIPPNDHTFPSIIKAATMSSLSTGASLHSQVIKRGVLYDPFIQTSLLVLCAQVGDLLNARKVFEEILCPCVVEYNAMIDAYAKNGDMGSAVLLFNGMPKRDVISWTSVISGFVMNGLFREAIRFFRVMIEHGNVMCGLFKPNEATFVSMLSSCANIDGGGRIYLGKQIHGFIIKSEVVLTAFMGTALIDFYGKVGCLNCGIKIFNQMLVKEICTWNAMIYSLANNGRERQALNLFEKMKEKGPCPNVVTFVAVLTACARAKLVDIGLELFQSMFSEFGVVPIMEHYGCVVDLMGRAGLLKEASEFIKSMPFEADASVLGALLGACRIHEAIEQGNEVGMRLLELQPQHSGQYVVLSNINAGVEKWSLAAHVRKTMVKAGIRKVPAYSLMDSM